MGSVAGLLFGVLVFFSCSFSFYAHALGRRPCYRASAELLGFKNPQKGGLRSSEDIKYAKRLLMAGMGRDKMRILQFSTTQQLQCRPPTPPLARRRRS